MTSPDCKQIEELIQQLAAGNERFRRWHPCFPADLWRGPGRAWQCSSSCRRATRITSASSPPPLEPSSPRLLAACSLAAPIQTGGLLGRAQPCALTRSSRSLTTGPSGARRKPQMRKGRSRGRRFKAASTFTAVSPRPTVRALGSIPLLAPTHLAPTHPLHVPTQTTTPTTPGARRVCSASSWDSQ